MNDAFAGFGALPGPERDALQAARERLRGGAPWKAALEELLLALAPDAAERLQQILRESRGSWLGLLRASTGRALFVGDPLSGTAIALARAGFDVVLLADDELRLDVARRRARALVAADAATRAARRGRVEVALGDLLRAPFSSRTVAFDLVVVEGDPRAEATRAAARLSRGEVALVVENRLAYKRWTGKRGGFRVPTPLDFARGALDPRRPEATLAGYARRLSSAGAADVRAFALYPHALDYALIAALRGPLPGGGPALFVGPKERENRLKIAAYRMGALPLAAPSFAMLGGRSTGPTRIERVLAALAERIGEPVPRARQWIASRGNTTIVQTSPDGDPEDERGRWTIHVPHQPAQARQARRHFARLGELRERFVGFPAPAPLFAGVIDGQEVFCERRIVGLTAPQAVGRVDVLTRTFGDAARLLASLVVEPRATMDAATFDALVAEKVALVRRYAAVESTRRWLDRARDRAAERLIGAELPLVVYHADLRSKHVVIDPSGAIAGILDWGSSESRDLPYFDLLHLIVHERKQAAGTTPGQAWREIGDEGSIRSHERAALAGYAARVGLAPEVADELHALYPVLVAAMAERNWDYSRPRWLHASFGL